MNKQIGFIGCGKMGQAMIQGMLSSKHIHAEQIRVSSASEETLANIEQRFDIKGTLNNQEVAWDADFLFLAIKPGLHQQIISEIRDHVKESVVIITIAAGITITSVEEAFGRKIKIIRTMPNTPSLVREGITAMARNASVSDTDMNEAAMLFNSFGKTEFLDEGLMDSVPAISGSSPAYVYMFIEALADGGVRDGIPRNQAYRMAAQAVLGAAKMVLETEIHPGILKDDVCTPGGSTIEAVAALEKNGFRAAVLEAMTACTGRSKSLS
jgi:pyrroline-5-carboxylate reductase